MAEPDPIFFFSYSQADTNDYLDRFFEDLRWRVSNLLGLGIKKTDSDFQSRLNRVGFRDVYGVKTGEDWTTALGAAISRNGVLVCLYSPNFFAPEPGFCGKEFEAFLTRHGNDIWYAPRTSTDDKNFQLHGWRNIVPVLWEGVADLTAVGLPPYVLSTIKRDLERGDISVELNQKYIGSGMRLMAKRPKSDAYERVLGHFARQIRDMRAKAPPPLGDHINLQGLRNAFWDPPDQNRVRRDVSAVPVAELRLVPPPTAGPNRFLAITVRGGGADATTWRPYKDNAEKSITTAVEELANREKVAIDWAAFDPLADGFPERVHDALRDAERRSNRAILLVDAHCLGDAAQPLKALLGKPCRAGFLVVADGQDAAALALIERHRAELQPATDAPNWVVRFSAGTMAQLRVALGSLAADMLARIVRTDDVPRKAPDNGGPATRPRIANRLDEAA